MPHDVGRDPTDGTQSPDDPFITNQQESPSPHHSRLPREDISPSTLTDLRTSVSSLISIFSNSELEMLRDCNLRLEKSNGNLMLARYSLTKKLGQVEADLEDSKMEFQELRATLASANAQPALQNQEMEALLEIKVHILCAYSIMLLTP
jgi:hypothetical protein